MDTDINNSVDSVVVGVAASIAIVSIKQSGSVRNPLTGIVEDRIVIFY